MLGFRSMRDTLALLLELGSDSWRKLDVGGVS